MKKPEIPANEAVRLQCVMSSGLLDSPPDERFDRITRLTQRLFGVPITYIALIDKERQWFKSKMGLTITETPRDISFCGHAILGSDIFCIPNAHADERFKDNPMVIGPPNITFYAGMPLSGYDGSKMGTLCIIDTQPRDLTEEDISAMRDLADCVESEILLIHERQRSSNLKFKEERLQAVIEAITDGEITLNQDGTIKTFSPVAEGVFETTAANIVGKHVSVLVPIDLVGP